MASRLRALRSRRKRKIAIAVELDKLGVHSIEPGLPVTEEDKEVITTLSQMNLRAHIVPLARVNELDVRNSIDAKADGMVLEMTLNPYLIRDAFKTNPDDLIKQVAEYSKAGKEAGMYVEYMAWDVMRIEGWEYPERFFRDLVEHADLDRVTVADTFGMAHPLHHLPIHPKTQGVDRQNPLVCIFTTISVLLTLTP